MGSVVEAMPYGTCGPQIAAMSEDLSRAQSGHAHRLRHAWQAMSDFQRHKSLVNALGRRCLCRSGLHRCHKVHLKQRRPCHIKNLGCMALQLGHGLQLLRFRRLQRELPQQDVAFLSGSGQNLQCQGVLMASSQETCVSFSTGSYARSLGGSLDNELPAYTAARFPPCWAHFIDRTVHAQPAVGFVLHNCSAGLSSAAPAANQL